MELHIWRVSNPPYPPFAPVKGTPVGTPLLRSDPSAVKGGNISVLKIVKRHKIKMPRMVNMRGVNTVRLTVRGELVEPPATNPESFDKLRTNGIFLNLTVL